MDSDYDMAGKASMAARGLFTVAAFVITMFMVAMNWRGLTNLNRIFWLADHIWSFVSVLVWLMEFIRSACSSSGAKDSTYMLPYIYTMVAINGIVTIFRALALAKKYCIGINEEAAILPNNSESVTMSEVSSV